MSSFTYRIAYDTLRIHFLLSSIKHELGISPSTIKETELRMDIFMSSSVCSARNSCLGDGMEPASIPRLSGWAWLEPHRMRRDFNVAEVRSWKSPK